jgi:hypothetical protein
MQDKITIHPISTVQDRPNERSWLIEKIWAAEAVGLIGGEPKCCKSFLAAEIAVCVAGGGQLLGHYACPESGRVLYLPAEDSTWAIKERMAGIAKVRGLKLEDLPIDLIEAPGLNLSSKDDRDLIYNIVRDAKAKLLIMDPFARLSGSNENSSANIAPILDDLRRLQRTSGTSIILVHHFRKNNASTRNGQALRGSSEFHAWGDSNIYMRRSQAGQLIMSVEHRNAPGIDELGLELKTDDMGARLEPRADNQANEKLSLCDRIIKLVEKCAPISVNQIADQVGVRKSRVCDEVRSLVDAGKLTRDERGVRLNWIPDYQTSAVSPWEVMEPVVGNPDQLRW